MHKNYYKCKFGTECKDTSCIFYHSGPCKYGPECKKYDCTYDHRHIIGDRWFQCKFGNTCKRIGCQSEHIFFPCPDGQNCQAFKCRFGHIGIVCPFGNKCVNNNCVFEHDSIMCVNTCMNGHCKFNHQGIKCIRQNHCKIKGCKFTHPYACENGYFCYDDECNNMHDNFKSTLDCIFGRSCVIYNCGYVHPKKMIDNKKNMTETKLFVPYDIISLIISFVKDPRTLLNIREASKICKKIIDDKYNPCKYNFYAIISFERESAYSSKRFETIVFEVNGKCMHIDADFLNCWSMEQYSFKTHKYYKIYTLQYIKFQNETLAFDSVMDHTYKVVTSPNLEKCFRRMYEINNDTFFFHIKFRAFVHKIKEMTKVIEENEMKRLIDL